MGLFNRRSMDGTTNSTTTSPHHTGRDAAIAGGLAHHEANNHPTRDGILGAGVVGETQHHRNEKALNDPYNATGTTGTGVGHHHHTGRDAALAGGLAHHEATNHPTRDGLIGAGAVGETQHLRNEHNGYGGAHTGPGVGAGAGTGAVHTGPAPLAGVHANQGTSGGPNATPTLKEAKKLEKKGKMEATMGDLFCSSSMKHKSANHLAQADHLKMQASELTEAERLEQEAGLRRQRAVGLGADPVHGQGTTGHGRNGVVA